LFLKLLALWLQNYLNLVAFLIHFYDTFDDFSILLGNFLQDFFGSWTSELWYFTFWVILGVSGTHQSGFFFLRFSKVFTCIQFKHKLISPIFSDMFWPNFTNNPCKTTTGIPSKKYANIIIALHTWSVCEICAKHRRTKIMCFFKTFNVVEFTQNHWKSGFHDVFWSVCLVFLHTVSFEFPFKNPVIFWCVSHVEICLSKSKQMCLLEFTMFLLIPVLFLPNFKTFYQTLSNLGPNFSIFFITFGKLLQRIIYWQ